MSQPAIHGDYATRVAPHLSLRESSVRIPWTGVVIFVALGNLVAHAQSPISVAYSFSKDGRGGIASVEIAPSSGRIESHQVLLSDPQCTLPGKLRRSQDGDYLAVTNLVKTGPHVFLFKTVDRSVQTFQLPAIPDELRFAPDQLLVSCEEDALAVIRWKPNSELNLLRLDKILSPPANGPEDVQIVAEEQLAVVTCQKDGKGGKKKGHRVVLVELHSRQILADLQLPRDRPQLHIDQNTKESGPSPEVIFVSKKSDSLVLTLDLYGAIGMMRWSSAKQGQLVDWTTLSTSPAETWGTAFPDRGVLLPFGNRDYLLIHNAGEEGGSCVVDLQKRRIVWRRPTPPGLEQSVYFPQLRRAFTVCSGKVKKRTATDVLKESKPQMGLFHFDFRTQQTVRQGVVEKYPLKLFAARIHAVSTTPPLLLLAVGSNADRPDRLLTFDPVAMQIRDQQPAQGVISQFER